MTDRIGRIGRVHLRVERGNFYRNVNDRKQLGIFPHWIQPSFSVTGQHFHQLEAARSILRRLLLTYYRFAEQVDRESNSLAVSLPQRLHHVPWIFAGDELPRHSGNVPPQYLPADPRRDFS